MFVGVGALGACGRDAAEPRAGRKETGFVAGVVARVGEHPIGVAELEAQMRARGIDAEAALKELIDQELLLQEAERLGLGDDAKDEQNIERRMVRAMLHDLERENTPESIPRKELREDYARHEDKFHIPERRRSWHILVKDSSAHGEARAESILREMRQADDPRKVFDAYARADADPDVKAEDLPAITSHANIERSYKEALFAARRVGPLDHVVRTSYGWHAIFVAEILPARQRTLAEVEEDSRKRLSEKKRFERLIGIIKRLEAQGRVEYDESGVQQLLSMPNLPGAAR